jgi:hypothetical protein
MSTPVLTRALGLVTSTAQVDSHPRATLQGLQGENRLGKTTVRQKRAVAAAAGLAGKNCWVRFGASIGHQFAPMSTDHSLLCTAAVIARNGETSQAWSRQHRVSMSLLSRKSLLIRSHTICVCLRIARHTSVLAPKVCSFLASSRDRSDDKSAIGRSARAITRVQFRTLDIIYRNVQDSDCLQRLKKSYIESCN